MIRYIKTLSLFIAVSAVILLILFFLIPNQAALENARNGLDRISPMLFVIRVLIIGTLWLYWNRLFAWVYADHQVVMRAYMQSRRHVFALAFLSIELLLVQNLPGRLWQVFA